MPLPFSPPAVPRPLSRGAGTGQCLTGAVVPVVRGSPGRLAAAATGTGRALRACRARWAGGEWSRRGSGAVSPSQGHGPKRSHGAPRDRKSVRDRRGRRSPCPGQPGGWHPRKAAGDGMVPLWGHGGMGGCCNLSLARPQGTVGTGGWPEHSTPKAPSTLASGLPVGRIPMGGAHHPAAFCSPKEPRRRTEGPRGGKRDTPESGAEVRRGVKGSGTRWGPSCPGQEHGEAPWGPHAATALCSRCVPPPT